MFSLISIRFQKCICTMTQHNWNNQLTKNLFFITSQWRWAVFGMQSKPPPLRVNFIIILQAAFAPIDLHWWSYWLTAWNKRRKSWTQLLVVFTGLNFTNIFMLSFYTRNFQTHKNSVKCQYLFTLLRSTGAKATHRTLVKLTFAFNFINVLHARFLYKILVKNFKPKTQLWYFWCQNFVWKTLE